MFLRWLMILETTLESGLAVLCLLACLTALVLGLLTLENLTGLIVLILSLLALCRLAVLVLCLLLVLRCLLILPVVIALRLCPCGCLALWLILRLVLYRLWILHGKVLCSHIAVIIFIRIHILFSVGVLFVHKSYPLSDTFMFAFPGLFVFSSLFL